MANEPVGGGGGGDTATTYWPRAVATDAGLVVQQGGRDQVAVGERIVELAGGLQKLRSPLRRRALRELDFELAKVAAAIAKSLDAIDATRDILSEHAQQLALEAGRRNAADE